MSEFGISKIFIVTPGRYDIIVKHVYNLNNIVFNNRQQHITVETIRMGCYCTHLIHGDNQGNGTYIK